MAEITDIQKLAPSLLDKSPAQLEREITERQMALMELKRREDEKMRAAALDEANRIKDDIVDALVKLERTGHISESVRGFFTTKAGVFSPHLFFKKAKT